MYKNCMFCAKPLGANAVVETFPVGRRLAFDVARGRLWVVCRKCERWNLTPVEERWEAVEDCERIFRGTRVRVSTENIGLARHPEGLTLVRIGRPMRPEFAAWRYGDQFGRRMKRAVLYGAGAVVVVGGFAAGGLAAGMAVGTGNLGFSLVNFWINGRAVVRLRPDHGRVIKLKRPELASTRIRPGDSGRGFKVRVGKGKKATWHEGEEARRFAAAILPKVNAMGGTTTTVRRAVGEIETAGHPEAFLADLAQRRSYQNWRNEPGYVKQMPKPTKLALEMALHEEQERRAMEGELWLLERAWEEAEEIAAISDNLLLPEGAEEFIREHGGGGASGGDGTGDHRKPPSAPMRPSEP